MERMMENDIFRFVAVRPPLPPEPEEAELNFIRDLRIHTDNGTVIGENASSLYGTEPETIPDIVEEIARSHDIRAMEGGLWDNYQRLLLIYDKAYPLTEKSFYSLDAEITKILGVSAKEFLTNDPGVIELRDRVWDSYYASYLLSLFRTQNLESLTKGLRACHLLTFVAEGRVNKSETLAKILEATPLIDKLFTDIPRPVIGSSQNNGPTILASDNDYEPLWSRLADTHRAIEEIRKLQFETEEVIETAYEREADENQGEEELAQEETKAEEEEVRQTIRSVSRVSQGSFQSLNESTKSILASNNMNQENISVPAAISDLQKQMSELITDLTRLDDYSALTQIPAEVREIPGVEPIIEIMEDRLAPVLFNTTTGTPSKLKPLGIADLKVVRMRLKKYVAGEIAHIENVLKGESKERNHRTLERLETMFTTSLEETEELSRDTQTNERLQIKTEAEKTVEHMGKADVGTKVTAKYGAVQVEVTGNIGWQGSLKNVTKMSSDHAREVIDKSVARISKKIKEERVTKTLRETEEKNIHKIDNSGGAVHTVGIYRWVDMLYEAQIFNYGKRLMMQFIIPEPSAYYEFAKKKYENWLKAQATDALERPAPFTLKTPDGITEENYLNFIKLYNVEGIEPPPPEFQTISIGLGKKVDDKVDDFVDKDESAKLKIPDGYEVEDIWQNLSYSLSYTRRESSMDNRAVIVLVGNRIIFERRGDKEGQRIGAQRDGLWSLHREGMEGNNIPISVNLKKIATYILHVEIQCTRTENALMQWKIDTYKAIQQAYLDMKLEYEQKVAVQKELAEQRAGAAGVITGLNPGLNRDIEKTELKKQCVRLLMENCQGQKYGAFDASPVRNESQADFTDFSLTDAIQQGDYIQFFEQAFEWENMTYLFYPYFWANKAQWDMKAMTYDDDPQFTKFLQAGAARVMLPARKNYEDSVLNYLRTGKVWDGGTAPIADDPLFMSVADELKNQTDDSGGEADGEPWEVVVPTTQIYLQQDGVPLPDYEELNYDKQMKDPATDMPEPEPEDKNPGAEDPEPAPKPEKPEPDPEPEPEPEKPKPDPAPTKPEDPGPAPAGYKVGDIVQFTGGGVYVSSSTSAAPSANRGASICKLTQISGGNKYPYHLISEDKAQVYGWVAADKVKRVDG